MRKEEGCAMGNDKIQLFEDKRIRTAWDAEKEEWFFSIVDVARFLTLLARRLAVRQINRALL